MHPRLRPTRRFRQGSQAAPHFAGLPGDCTLFLKKLV